MEVMLDIENVPKVMNPTKDSVIVFNGKKWYLTTKESLFADAIKLIQEAKDELEKIKLEDKQFKQSVSSQIYEMSDLIRKLYEGGK